MGPRQQEEEEEEGASWPNNGIMDQRLSRARPPFWAGSSKSSGETRDLQDSINAPCPGGIISERIPKQNL